MRVAPLLLLLLPVMPALCADACSAALLYFRNSDQAGEQASERSLYQGICLAREARWPESAAYLVPYTRSRPGDVRGWFWLAQAQLYQKQFTEAHESIQQAIALDRKSAEAQRVLGEIELQRKDYDAAYRAWVTANKLNPLDSRTTYYLGRLFQEADFPNEAAAWLRETLRLKPNDFAAMTYLGLCAERLAMAETAAQLYRQAIRESKLQGKPYSWAFLSYSKLLRQQGDEAQALALLQEGEQLSPEAHLLTALGQLLASRRQNTQAEAVLRRVLEIDPSISEAHYRLSLLLRASGHDTKAAEEMRLYQTTKAEEQRNAVKISAVRKQDSQ